MTNATVGARSAAAVLIALATLVAGCSLEKGSSDPALIGPSEFGLSVVLSATPDVLPRDGSSQAVVTITVRNERGAPVAGQRLVLAVSGPTGTRLSATEVTTGSDGRAVVSVTAPTQAGVGSSVITVSATPVGTNADNAAPRFLSIALTGEPNTGAPVPSFTVTPADPDVNAVVEFDASASTDEGVACGDRCTYTWNFGDGASATGRIVTHRFAIARDHTVTLTVRDRAGLSTEARQTVAVSAVAAPTITFSVSPTSPLAGAAATFTATAAAAPGHSIQSYIWSWGDGSSDTTSTGSTQHTFATPGSYVVSVTAVDDLGQRTTASSTVTVVTGVTAAFTFSPTNPRTGDNVVFNGSSSSASGGATIVEWNWDFGDGTTDEDNDDPSTTHSFSAARTYVVRLTVVDSQGRTGTTTQNVTVLAP